MALRLEVRHYETVAAIIEHGSVTTAAMALSISQSALSHRLADAEQRMGVVLFDRGPGRRLQPNVGSIVGTAPVRPHQADAADGDWQHCANEPCEVIFHLGADTVDTASVITQVGLKATDKATPVCFCFAHAADALGEDLAANDGVSRIKAAIKAAVADSECACEHLNPSGKCCLADVRRTLKSCAQPTQPDGHRQRGQRTRELKQPRSANRE